MDIAFKNLLNDITKYYYVTYETEFLIYCLNYNYSMDNLLIMVILAWQEFKIDPN